MTRPRRPVAAGPLLGAELELEIGPVAPGGHCVARHEGRVVFVRHALPGERVLALVTEDGGGSYCRADAIEVRTPSPDRVPPPCPWSGPGRCGGCDFQHVSVPAQRRLKAAVIKEQLSRIGGLPGPDDAVLEPDDAVLGPDAEGPPAVGPAAAGLVAGLVVEPLPGGALAWRSRMRFAVDRHGRAGLRRHRSHRVVPIEDCPIAAPAVRTADVVAQRWPRAAEVDVAVSGSGARVVRRLTRTGAATRLAGPARLTERAVGRDWRVSAGAFWQVHPAAADALASCVLQLLAPTAGERVLDLYGGVGLFAGALASVVGPTGAVLCVEGDRTAAADAVVNLAGMPWASVRAARVDAALLAGLPAYDLVVLDPPRSGAGRAVCAALAGLRPRAIGYVACDPAALARDVRTFTELGWQLAGLRAFDAFPMTHHVECVALLVPAT